jgi:O-antigen biosynthesis protein
MTGTQGRGAGQVANIGVRGVEALRVLRDGGPRRLAQRVARAASYRLGTSELDFPLELDDIADSRTLALAVPARRPARGTPLKVGWVCTPPSPRSGGHTTMFRMVEAVEAAGHTCVVYLYDRFNGLRSRHENVIRTCWPGVRAEVRSVTADLEPLDAYVASGWQTAHVLAARASLATRRLYLVQDFEPYFYARGSEYVLAEDTYRFGFRCVTIGWLAAEILQKQFGVRAEVAEYGCDTGVYQLTNPGSRSGVAFYAMPGAPRRGFELGLLGLREFHRRRPDQQIHIFGDPRAHMPFPVINHGRTTPARLSQLYNSCRAGLTLSFTNVSLVAAEMLACGTVPVMSGWDRQLADLDNPVARLAEPAPSAIAEQLCAAVDSLAPSPAEVAASVPVSSWKSGQGVCVETIENEVYG